MADFPEWAREGSSLRNDLRDLIGIPFVDGGKNIKTGLDCYGLCQEVSRRYGLDLPDFERACYDAITIHMTVLDQAVSTNWTRLPEPEPGCLVAMAIDPEAPDICQHIAIYIGENEIMQTIVKIGSHVIKADHRFYKNKIKGYYRWNGNH